MCWTRMKLFFFCKELKFTSMRNSFNYQVFLYSIIFGTNKEFYWYLFLKLQVPEAYLEHLR